MSSFINKSKKAFKPRAPNARRNEYPQSTTSSIRGSQDPQRSNSLLSGHNLISPSLSPSHPRVPSPDDPRSTPSARPATNKAVDQLLPTPAPTQGSASQDVADASDVPGKRGSGSAGRQQYQPRKRVRVDDSTIAVLEPSIAAETPGTQNEDVGAEVHQTRVVSSTDNISERGNNALSTPSQDAQHRTSEVGTAQDARPEELRDPQERNATLATRASTKNKPKASADGIGKELHRAQSSARRAKRSTRSAAVDQESREQVAPGIIEPDPHTERQVHNSDTTELRDVEQEASAELEPTDATAWRRTRSQAKAVPPNSSVDQHADKDSSVSTNAKSKRIKAMERRAGAIVAQATTKRPSKKKGSARAANGGSKGREKTAGRRKGRSATPENAEAMEIDVEKQKLGDLPKLKVGRLGPREQKLRERDLNQAADLKARRLADARAEEEEFAGLEGEQLELARDEKDRRLKHDREEAAEREQRERVWRIEDDGQWSFKPPGRWGRHRKEDHSSQDVASRAIDSTANTAAAAADENDAEGDAGENNAAADRSESPFENVFHSSVPAFRIVDGKIVADPNARALDAPASTQVVEQREQTDIDRKVTEASFRYREPRGRWDPARVAAFYEGLRRWGTDFGMVATWVPGMSRNQVKRKFTLEERANPELVLEALRKENRIATTLAEIQERRGGRPLSDPREWQADMDRREAELRERARRDKEAAEELLRNRGITTDGGDGEGEGEDGGSTVVRSIEGAGGAADAGGARQQQQQQQHSSSSLGRNRPKGAAAPPAVINYGMP